MQISGRTIQRLQEHIDGDKHQGKYRSGPELVRLFNEFIANDSYGQGFPSRWQYTQEKLRDLNGNPELIRLIETVFKPLEYEAGHDEALQDINAYLVRDGCQIVSSVNGVKVVGIHQSLTASTDAIDRFAQTPTLEELISAIERDVAADSPVAALDRLHTYCMKKFGHLLDERGVEWSRSEPLHSRVGKYVRSVNSDATLSDMTKQIVKNSIGVFDKYNYIRNNGSLAHDNELIGKNEARFIFDSVSAVLRFIKQLDAAKFEN